MEKRSPQRQARRQAARQAVSLSLPAASIAAPIEGSKTSQAGTFRAWGGMVTYSKYIPSAALSGYEE